MDIVTTQGDQGTRRETKATLIWRGSGISEPTVDEKYKLEKVISSYRKNTQS